MFRIWSFYGIKCFLVVLLIYMCVLFRFFRVLIFCVVRDVVLMSVRYVSLVYSRLKICGVFWGII